MLGRSRIFPAAFGWSNIVQPASLLSIWTTKAGVSGARIHPNRPVHATTSHGVFEASSGHSPFCFDYSVATPTPGIRDSVLLPRSRYVGFYPRRMWVRVNKSHFVHSFRYLSVPHGLFRVFTKEVSWVVSLLPCRLFIVGTMLNFEVSIPLSLCIPYIPS